MFISFSFRITAQTLQPSSVDPLDFLIWTHTELYSELQTFDLWLDSLTLQCAAGGFEIFQPILQVATVSLPSISSLYISSSVPLVNPKWKKCLSGLKGSSLDLVATECQKDLTESQKIPREELKLRWTWSKAQNLSKGPGLCPSTRI